jgi:hypothetical protein
MYFLLGATAVTGAMLIIGSFYCDCKVCEKFVKKMLPNSISKKCAKNTSRLAEPFLVFLFLTAIVLFYSIFLLVSVSKGNNRGLEILSSVKNNYSSHTERQYYNKHGRLMAQGVELICSEKWCAIYYKDGSVVEVAMDSIGGIQKLNHYALKVHRL